MEFEERLNCYSPHSKKKETELLFIVASGLVGRTPPCASGLADKAYEKQRVTVDPCTKREKAMQPDCGPKLPHTYSDTCRHRDLNTEVINVARSPQRTSEPNISGFSPLRSQSEQEDQASLDLRSSVKLIDHLETSQFHVDKAYEKQRVTVDPCTKREKAMQPDYGPKLPDTYSDTCRHRDRGLLSPNSHLM
ncbi:extracellular matrix-binding protein ebh, partial [Striga asiatica]